MTASSHSPQHSWTRCIALLAALCAMPSPGTPTAQAQSTPEQRYFEWTELAFPPQEYATRRARLVEALGPEDGLLLLVPSLEGTSDGGTFRQDDDFYYLTGLELPRSILVVDAATGSSRVYAPRRDPRFHSDSRPNDFPGRPLADDPDLGRRAGVEVLPFAEFDGALAGAVATGRTIALLEAADLVTDTALFAGRTAPAQRLAAWLARTHPELKVRDRGDAMATVRSIKSPAEVERLEAAATLTERAIRAAARLVEDGVDERTLEGAFEAECKRGGSARVPFDPIIKSGANSLWPWRILAAHYERRNRAMHDGELVIFDVGCSVDQYVSDVGRTFPVSGRFTDEQRAILRMETAVADRIIEAIRPGVTFADLRRVSYEAIPDEYEPAMQVGLFFGHHLGLSTGDPAPVDRPLEPGMVFTVEPWFYDHVNGVSVFTEDVILVTATGARVLSAGLPRTPEELERLVGRR